MHRSGHESYRGLTLGNELSMEPLNENMYENRGGNM